MAPEVLAGKHGEEE
uniref:Uncharacterized protein n=1 Tax=Arundo donax TaxID=35708 RepID=A0A0A8YC33_ARUDO